MIWNMSSSMPSQPTESTGTEKGSVGINVASPNEMAISRPFVLLEDSRYKMWYSYRNGELIESVMQNPRMASTGIAWMPKRELTFRNRAGIRK